MFPIDRNRRRPPWPNISGASTRPATSSCGRHKPCAQPDSKAFPTSFEPRAMADTTHGLRYTTTHEWARSEGGDLVTVGITDIGRQALGKVVYIEFPVVGRRVNRGEPCAVVETSKSVCDICSPVSGQVLLVNERLSEDCALLGYDAYEARSEEHTSELQSRRDLVCRL